MVNVALSNGQNVTTSVANLQAMTKSQQQLLFNDFGKCNVIFPDQNRNIFEK